ncbi:hypothetical protein OF83DRAFT_845948 [Amylostereum chailletii]|nr:hypothetical protein OF83DRAFT_845948 [Amylostereum chailletii]
MDAEKRAVDFEWKYNHMARAYKHKKSALLKTDRELEVERRSHDEQVRALTRHNEELAALLERRSTELSAAQALLPSPGNLTDKQVVDMVQELNYELSQTAIVLSESFEDQLQVRPATEVLSESTNNLRRYVGARMVDLLRNSRKGKTKLDATTVLQIGFQACLAFCVHHIVSLWCFASEMTNSDINSIYKSLCRMEKDYVAMKWRNLTKKSAREALDRPSVETELVKIMANVLADAVVVAGFAVPGQGADSTEADLLSKASQRMEEIARLAMNLNGVVGQDFSPCTMTPYIADCGSPFDPETMLDGFSDVAGGVPNANADRRVLCSTDMGLIRLEGVGGKGHAVLVKPTVALDVLLDHDCDRDSPVVVVSH